MKNIFLCLLLSAFVCTGVLAAGFWLDARDLEAEKEKHRLNEIALMEQLAERDRVIAEAEEVIADKQTEVEFYKGLLDGSIQILLVPKEKEPR